MHPAEFPYLADWFAVSFRWLAILGVAISLALTHALNLPLVAVLLLAIFWNLFISSLAALNLRLTQHRPVNVAVDFAFSMAVFILTGEQYSLMIMAGVFVLLSSAIYYEWNGSLLAALLLSATEFGWVFAGNRGASFQTAGIPLALTAGINLTLALMFGLPARYLMQATRRTYQSRVSQVREGKLEAQSAEHERMQAFYRLIESLSATLNYQTVLDSALDLSIDALALQPEEAGRLVRGVLLFGAGGELAPAAARHFSPSDLKRSLPAQQGSLAESLRTGAPQYLSEPSHDPELSLLFALQGCRAALVLPLMRGLDAYGVMLYAHPEAAFFTQERVEMLEMLSHQAVIAIQNARLFQQLQVEKERIVESQDEVRKRLARDLHDGPTQAVSSIAMHAAVARKMLQKDPKSASAEIEVIEGIARRTTDEIRHMLFTLRPLVLESQGLEPALKSMTEKLLATFRQEVKLDVDPTLVEQLDLSKQTVIFYLVEEAVNNARKHAQASLITVRLKFFTQDRTIALLEIADNGKGFDLQSVTEEYEQRGSLGMVNLRERAELIDAYLNLQSAPGKGTRVQVYIPLTPRAVDRLQQGLMDRTEA